MPSSKGSTRRLSRILIVGVPVLFFLLFTLKEILEHRYGPHYEPLWITGGAIVTSLIFFLGIRIGLRSGFQKISPTDQALTKVVDFEHRLAEKERELGDRARKLAEHQEALVRLARTEAPSGADFQESLRRTAEIVSVTLGTDRMSLWTFHDQDRWFECLERFEPASRFHDAGHRVPAAECEAYVRALDSKRSIVVADPDTDARDVGKCLRKVSNWPFASFIDIPLRLGGKLAGVVCFDQVKYRRTWNNDDEHFAASVADLVSLQMERLERRKTEEALRESERKYSGLVTQKLRLADERYRALVEMSPTAVFIFDAKGRFTFANQITLNTLEITADEVPDVKNWPVRFQIRDAGGRPLESGAGPFSLAFKTQKTAGPTELSLTTKSGKHVHVSLTAVPIFDDKGNPDGVLGFAVDLSDLRETDRALREMEMRFRKFAENSDEILWMGSAAFDRVLYLSPAFETVFRLSLADMEKNPMLFLDRIHPEDRPKILESIEDRDAGPKVMEFRIVWPDGTVRWLYNRSFPVRGEDGQVAYFAGLTRDITRRYQAETAIQESEKRFRQIAENIQAVFWMTDVEKTHMVYVSPAYAAIWGRAREQLYQQPSSWADAILAEDRERVVRAALTKQLTGEYDEEYRIVRPDGEIRWIRDRAFPVRDAAGKIYRITGVATDVTVAKRAEHDLRLLASIVSMSVDAISTGKVDGTITSWNKAAEAIFGWRAEEIIGRDVQQAFVPGERAHEAELTLRKDPKAVLRIRTERLHRDGRRIPVMMTTFPLIDEKGIAYGRAGLFQDLTSVVELEKKLMEQSRMAAIGSMAAGIAHEIRNPLFGISSAAQVLAREIAENPKLRELGDSMLGEMERLNRMLKNLLLFARPRRIEPADVRPRELIGDFLQLHETVLKEKHIALDSRFRPEKGSVRVDRDQVRQVILNLGLNAIQASPPGDKISIESDIDPQGSWTLRILNRGEPIPPNNLSTVFEPFFSTKAEGSGLGLSVCRKIVEDHGGIIWCESDAGRGTLFTFRLPPLLDEPAQSGKNGAVP